MPPALTWSRDHKYSDLHTYQYPPNSLHATSIELPPGSTSNCDCVITQCKRYSLYNHNSTWNQGEAQLNRYLSATHGTRRWGTRLSVYSIVAVGHVVRFYKYNDRQQRVSIWSPPRANVGGNGRLDITDVQQRRTVQRTLNYIRSHH